MNPQSPTRLVTKAFLPAVAADSRVCQKAISRYEHVPTPSHPRNVTRRFSPSTSNVIAKTKRLRYRKNFENFGSPCMYPIANMWISPLMNVTNRHIAIDSGSARSAASIRSVPTGTQENSVDTSARSSSGRPRRSR